MPKKKVEKQSALTKTFTNPLTTSDPWTSTGWSASNVTFTTPRFTPATNPASSVAFPTTWTVRLDPDNTFTEADNQQMRLEISALRGLIEQFKEMYRTGKLDAVPEIKDILGAMDAGEGGTLHHEEDVVSRLRVLLGDLEDVCSHEEG